jgi:ATP-dependent Clp protease protease subunit
MRKFWNFIKNEASQSAELLLYGELSSETWFGDETTPKQFDADLKALGNITDLTVRVYSPGGDVFAGQAITCMLQRHPANKTGIVDGLAASAATLPLMVCNTVIMPRNAMILVHNPWTIAMGNADDMRKMADDLDRVREAMLPLYEAKTGMSRDDLTALMDKNEFLTAEQAVEYGFADVIEEPMKVAARWQGFSAEIPDPEPIPEPEPTPDAGGSADLEAKKRERILTLQSL